MNRKKYLQVSESQLRGVVRTNLDSPNPTKSQLSRKARNIAVVRVLGLPYSDHLPVIEDINSVQPRTAADIGQRCLALTLCAVKGELQGESDEIIQELLEKWSVRPFLSPTEEAFIRNESPAAQEYIDHCWGYECVHILMWALGHLTDIKSPHSICDVPGEMSLLRGLGAEGLVKEARLRSQEEIFEAADLYYRLHWAAIQLRLDGKSSTQIDEGIVRERHRALNWLIRYMGAEWDNVTTDT